MTVEIITEILENELKNAVEVKDGQSLHRYIALLSENLVSRNEHAKENSELRSDLKQMLVLMKEPIQETNGLNQLIKDLHPFNGLWAWASLSYHSDVVFKIANF